MHVYAFSQSYGADLPNGKGMKELQNFPKIAKILMNNGMYFTAVPFIKEYISSKEDINTKQVDQIIDELVTFVGVKQFEILPKKILARSNAPIIRYILAKKLFRHKKYSQALKTLEQKTPENHSIMPFSLMLKGSIYSVSGKYKKSINSFKRCIEISNKQLSNVFNKVKKRQLEINRDSCLVGIARSQFANKKHGIAHLSYLDLSKKSHLWPEILFEEAWNSFYLKDYNRTLGKLVTYKSPFFSHIFNPEIAVLRTLTYYKLCYWNDALKEVESFYKKYEIESKGIKKLLKKHGANYIFYYEAAKKRFKGNETKNILYNRILHSISRDSTFQELFDTYIDGRAEAQKLKTLNRGGTKRALEVALKEALNMQRNILGAYVRKNIKFHLRQLDKAFQGMSYIKLQVIALKKRELYAEGKKVALERARGGVEQLARNDKQYFWNFVGEFWADELGDYVFALESECKR